MGFLRVMENTSGLMDPDTKEILNKAIKMAMGYGQLPKKDKNTKATICSIESMATGSIGKQTEEFTRDPTLKTQELAKVNYLKMKN